MDICYFLVFSEILSVSQALHPTIDLQKAFQALPGPMRTWFLIQAGLTRDQALLCRYEPPIKYKFITLYNNVECQPGNPQLAPIQCVAASGRASVGDGEMQHSPASVACMRTTTNVFLTCEEHILPVVLASQRRDCSIRIK
jgi:hypothetical protein